MVLALRLATFGGVWVGVVAEDPRGETVTGTTPSALVAALLRAGWTPCARILAGVNAHRASGAILWWTVGNEIELEAHGGTRTARTSRPTRGGRTSARASSPA